MFGVKALAATGKSPVGVRCVLTWREGPFVIGH